MAKKKMWYVANKYRVYEGKYLTLRGPYKHAETAGAVREEMERSASDQEDRRGRGYVEPVRWNLAVVWDWVEVPDAVAALGEGR